MNLKKVKRIVSVVFLLVVFVFFSDLNFAKATGNCTPIKSGFQCYDTGSQKDKFVDGTCTQGLCPHQSGDILCCQTKVVKEEKCGEGSLKDKKCVETKGMTPKQKEDAKCVTHKCPNLPTSVLCCVSSALDDAVSKKPPVTASSGGGGGCVEPITGVAIPCPLGTTSIPVLIGRVLSWALGLSGTVFLLMFLYGGVEYIIFADENQKAENGKKTIVYAVIGMAIIAFSTIILKWVLNLLR